MNYFHLKFKSLVDHEDNYQKYLLGAVLKNIFRKIFCKLLSNHLWQSLFLVKSYAFSIFL